MYIYKIYLILSAVFCLVLNNFYPVFSSPSSWWLAPLIFILFFVFLFLLQCILFVLMILTRNIKKEPSFSKFFRYLLKITLPVIIKAVRVTINFEGIEKLPEDTPLLFVCNHQHDVDPAVILDCFRDSDIAFIGKKEIYTEMPFIARAMHLINSFPIDRENDREAAKTIIKAIKTIKEKSVSIAIFPEGYTSRTCELLPFRNGCFKIALKAECPIAVCVLNNTRQVPKNLFIRKTEVTFKLLDVLYYEDIKDKNTAEIGSIIHEKIKNELDILRK